MNTIPHVTHYVKWKELDLFPNHFISNTGLFRVGKTISKPIVKRKPLKTYYFVFVFTKTDRGNIRHHYDIHRLVWEYFGTGEKPKRGKTEIHHKDHNPANNHIDNLELLPMLKHKAIHRSLSNSSQQKDSDK